MNLGKCPICKGKLEIYKSIDDGEGFKRYDPLCKTDGCMVADHENYSYEDREKLIGIIRSSQQLAGIKPDQKPKKENNKLTESQKRSVDFLDKKKRPRKIKKKSNAKVKEPVIHYNRREKGICGHKGRLTKNIKDVTCGNCKNNTEFKKLKSKQVNK